MSSEVVSSLTSRITSLEDIIRGQESTLTILLSRLRDVEQFVGAEARSREHNQQQLTQLLGDRGGAAQLADKLNLVIQNQNDRISALQAEAQSTKAGLQGVDQKYDTAFRGLEQRLQGDLSACYDRIKAGETATADALRNVQTSLQGMNGSLQQVDTNARDAAQQLQQHFNAEIASLRQRLEALDGSVRGALQDVHGSLTNDINALEAKLEDQLRTAVAGQNGSLQALDERVRGEMVVLNQKEGADVAALRQRIDDGLASVQASVQSAHNALTSEVANVAQHSRGVEAQHQASHQMLLQELGKHDQHLEAVDNNWRSSVMELRGTTQQETAALREQTRAADARLQEQIADAQRAAAAAAEKLSGDIKDVSQAMQERCVQPMDQLNVIVTRHGERIIGLQNGAEDTRAYLRTFAQEVDRNATQFRTVIETALRASHSDLLDRINVVSAAAALHTDPEEVHAKINDALTKIWNDVSGTFVQQRDVNGILKKVSALESAVRAEVVSLANQDGTLHHRIDELQVGLQRVQLDVANAVKDAAARADRGRESLTGAANGGGGGALHERNSVTAVREVAVRDLPNAPDATDDDSDPGRIGAGQRPRQLDPLTAAEMSELRTLLEDAKAVARDVMDSARTAEAAQDVSLSTLNDARRLLKQVQGMQDALERQRMAAPQSAASDHTPTRNMSGGAPVSPPPASASGESERPTGSRTPVPVTAIRDTYIVQMPTQSQETGAAGTPGRPQSASSTVKAVRLQQDLSAPADSPTYYIDLSANKGVGADERRDDATGTQRDSRPSTSSRPTSAANRGRATPTTEILMPTHMFVRKKEYNNFKDFTKQEIDAIWVELLGMKRTQGLSREEVNLLVSQAKQTVLAEVMGALNTQEREIIAMLHSIRLQINEMSAKPPLYMTDMKILQSSKPLEEVLRGQRSVRAVVSPTRTRAIESQEPGPYFQGGARRSSRDSGTSSARSSEAPLPTKTIPSTVKRRSYTPPQLDGPVLIAELSSPATNEQPAYSSFLQRGVSPPPRGKDAMRDMLDRAYDALPRDNRGDGKRIPATNKEPPTQHPYNGAVAGAPRTVAPKPLPASEHQTPQAAATSTHNAPKASPKKSIRPPGEVPAFVRESRRLSLTDGTLSNASSPGSRRPSPQHGRPSGAAGGVATPLLEPMQGGLGTSTGHSLTSGPLVYQPLVNPRAPAQQPFGSSGSGLSPITTQPAVAPSFGAGVPQPSRSTGSGSHPSQRSLLGSQAMPQREKAPTPAERRPPLHSPPKRPNRSGSRENSGVFEDLVPKGANPYKSTADLAQDHENLAHQLGGLGGSRSQIPLTSTPSQPLAEPGKPKIGGGPMLRAVKEEPQPYGSKPNSASLSRRPNPAANSFHLSPMPRPDRPTAPHAPVDTSDLPSSLYPARGFLDISVPSAGQPEGLRRTPPSRTVPQGLRPHDDDDERMSSVSAPTHSFPPAPRTVSPFKSSLRSPGDKRKPSPVSFTEDTQRNRSRDNVSPSEQSRSMSSQRRPASGSQRGLHAVPVDTSSTSRSSSDTSTSVSSSASSTPEKKPRRQRSRRRVSPEKPSRSHRKEKDTSSQPRKSQRSRDRRTDGSRSSSKPPRSAHRDAHSDNASALGSAPKAAPQPARRTSPAASSHHHDDSTSAASTPQHGASTTSVASVRVLPGANEPVRVSGNYAAPQTEARPQATGSSGEGVAIRIGGTNSQPSHPYGGDVRRSGSTVRVAPSRRTSASRSREHPYEEL